MNYEDLSNLTIASDNIEELLCVFPTSWRKNFDNLDRPLDTLIEFVVDLGRLAMARFQDEMCPISDQPVEYGDLDYIASYVSQFSSDNRAGIDATLHRISAIRNRHGRIVGLTARVGRAVYGDADIIKDIIKSGRSILLLGQPGVGKTTVLREISRVLADELKQRVVIVDTSNEIAGDGDIPHPGVGSARRLQVADPALQHNVMIEAVENHTPQVVVIDEIGTEAEAYAA
ncbi:MAG: AAA family ATPase, partial [bacterium]|nr:AAA family ATPase [bacterium]